MKQTVPAVRPIRSLVPTWRAPRPNAFPSPTAPSAPPSRRSISPKKPAIFEKHGLFVDPVYVACGTKVAQAMIAGEFPVALAGGTVVNANLAGGDIVIFGGLVNVPSFYVFVHPSIKRPEDLKGKDSRHHHLRLVHRFLHPLSDQEIGHGAGSRCENFADGRPAADRRRYGRRQRSRRRAVVAGQLSTRPKRAFSC